MNARNMTNCDALHDDDDDDNNNNNNNNNNSIQFFITYVPSQQLQVELQTQHIVDTI
jgi:hypothetical protein